MRLRIFRFLALLYGMALATPAAFAQNSGPGVLFDPDVPNFQHSQFSTLSASFDMARNRFQDHRTTFQPADLQINHHAASASNVQLGVQSDLNVQFANGTEDASFANNAERTSLDPAGNTRYSNMRLQFQNPDLQFLNFNP